MKKQTPKKEVAIVTMDTVVASIAAMDPKTREQMREIVRKATAK